MARRDFTINAMALRLADGDLLDPFGGLRRSRAARAPHRRARRASRDDPLRDRASAAVRLAARLRPAPETRAQMRAKRPGSPHVSAERIGGGIAADGLGELSKLLLGREPARALLLARDTGAPTHVIPEFAPCDRLPARLGAAAAAARGAPVRRRPDAADAGASLEVRLAALLHDLGKPEAEPDGSRPRRRSAPGSRPARPEAASLPDAASSTTSSDIVAGHAFPLDGPIDGLHARRFLAAHGDALAFELSTTRPPILRVKRVPDGREGRARDLRDAARARARTARIGSAISRSRATTSGRSDSTRARCSASRSGAARRGRRRPRAQRPGLAARACGGGAP